MSSKFLQAFVNNARVDNQALLDDLSARVTLNQVLTFCENYRIRGIGHFLLYGQADKLHLYLFKSGRAYLAFLPRIPEETQVTSRAAPFFDAVACLDLDGALAIAARSRATRHDGMEYPEDFLYVHFLMRHAFLKEPAELVGPMLDEYERVLQGSEDPRLEVCRALLARDAAGFSAALDHHMTAQKDRFDRLMQKEQVSQERWATVGQVSIEGLALVNVAASAGIPVGREVLCIPSLARARSAPPSTEDSWRDVEE
jgi:hypothetical protein